MSDTPAAPVLDEETTSALTLYNEYVDADRERTRREKRVKKAERAKEEAAATVKRLGGKGSAEEKAAAEQAYREANDTWRKLRDGEEPEPKAAVPEVDAGREAAAESDTGTATDEAQPEPDTKAAEPEAEPEPDTKAAEPEPEPEAKAAEPQPEPEPEAKAAEPEPEAKAAEPEPVGDSGEEE